MQPAVVSGPVKPPSRAAPNSTGDAALAEAATRRLFVSVRATVDQWERRVARRLAVGGDIGATGGSRALAEMSGGLRQLRLLIDRHMARLLRPDCLACRDAAEAAAAPPPAIDVMDVRAEPVVISAAGSIADLGGSVRWLAICQNTGGYAADVRSGCLVPWPSADEADREHLEPAPQPLVFASFDPAEGRRHLLVASLDSPGGGHRLRCEADIDWEDWLVGLHCDGPRRLLFAAQESTITAMDLAGRSVRVTRPAGCRIAGLTGGAESLFAYDRAGRRVLGIGKDSGICSNVVQLDQFSGWLVSGLAVWPDGRLLLSDYYSGRLHIVCPIGGGLLASYPGGECPAGVAVDASRGRVFSADSVGHVVRILSAADGGHLATLGGVECGAGDGSGDEDAFCCPTGVALLPAAGGGVDGSRQLLVVADSGNRRLQVFELT